MGMWLLSKYAQSTDDTTVQMAPLYTWDANWCNFTEFTEIKCIAIQVNPVKAF
jgi:hypothetical protein